jgi:hypothetical protein
LLYSTKSLKMSTLVYINKINKCLFSVYNPFNFYQFMTLMALQSKVGPYPEVGGSNPGLTNEEFFRTENSNLEKLSIDAQ